MALTRLHYHQQRRLLDLVFSDGALLSLTAEFLRVHSPSADVRGHGKPKLVANKREVAIRSISPIGHYGVRLSFDDGHDSGLYSFDYLLQLAHEHHALWPQYLAQLKAANASRDTLLSVRKLT